MLQDTVRASLEPGLVGGLHGSIAVRVGTGRANGVLFVRFAGVAKFLANNTFVREIPVVEEKVQVYGLLGLTSLVDGDVREVTGLAEFPADQTLLELEEQEAPDSKDERD